MPPHTGTLTSASAADLPKDAACKAWPNVPYPDGDLRCADLEMRALAAAARCAPPPMSKQHIRYLPQNSCYGVFAMDMLCLPPIISLVSWQMHIF